MHCTSVHVHVHVHINRVHVHVHVHVHVQVMLSCRITMLYVIPHAVRVIRDTLTRVHRHHSTRPSTSACPQAQPWLSLLAHFLTWQLTRSRPAEQPPSQACYTL